MTKPFNNKVIIIGADHHNTLAVVRNLGSIGCDIEILIHENKDLEDICLSKSKYAKNRTFVVAPQENKVLDWLLNHAEKKEKTVIFPCSDFATYIVDSNYNALKEKFIVPGFVNAPGRVAFLMDKMEQKKFADKYQIPMAKTWSIQCGTNELNINDISIPCIIKPEISATGSKDDILICKTKEELRKGLKVFSQKRYKNVLVQQFLIKKYEVCSYGCILSERQSALKQHFAGGYIKKTREYPINGGGSLTKAQFICEKDIDKLNLKVINELYENGYRGQYDIEFLVCENGVYLNEINFRHSGNGYALIQNGVNAPYYWCLDALGLPLPKEAAVSVEIGKTLMDDISDLRHRKEFGIGFLAWVGEFLKTDAHSIVDIKDVPGTAAFFLAIVKRKLKHKH